MPQESVKNLLNVKLGLLFIEGVAAKMIVLPLTVVQLALSKQNMTLRSCLLFVCFR